MKEKEMKTIVNVLVLLLACIGLAVGQVGNCTNSHNGNYTLVAADVGCKVTSATAGTYTLPKAGTAGFEWGKLIIIANTSSTASDILTINANAGVFYGSSTNFQKGSQIKLSGGQAVCIQADSPDWLVKWFDLGGSGGSGGGGSGTVNSGTTGQVAVYTAAGTTVGPSSLTVDPASCGGCSTQLIFAPGSQTLSTILTDYWSWIGPASITGGHAVAAPTTDPTTNSIMVFGAASTDGNGNKLSNATYVPVSATPAANIVPMTGSDGKIPSGFLPTSGGGLTPTFAAFSSKASTATPYYFIPTDWGTTYYNNGTTEVAIRPGFGQVTPPSSISSPLSGGGAVALKDGYAFNNCFQCFVANPATFGATGTVEAGDIAYVTMGNGVCGPAVIVDVNNMIIFGIKGPNDTYNSTVLTIIAGSGSISSVSYTAVNGPVLKRIRNNSGTLNFEESSDGVNWSTWMSTTGAFTMPTSTLTGTLHGGYACDGGRNAATLYHLKVQ